MIYPQNFEQKIGFDSIRQLLKEKCLSTLGEERVYDMAFSESYDEINRRLEEITEFIRIIQEEDDFPDQYFFDVRPSLKRIRVEGMYMEEHELFDLRRSLETIRDIVRYCNELPMKKKKKSPASPLIRIYVIWQAISWCFPNLSAVSTRFSTSMVKSGTMLLRNCSASDGNWLKPPEASPEATMPFSVLPSPKGMWTRM